MNHSNNNQGTENYSKRHKKTKNRRRSGAVVMLAGLLIIFACVAFAQILDPDQANSAGTLSCTVADTYKKDLDSGLKTVETSTQGVGVGNAVSVRTEIDAMATSYTVAKRLCSEAKNLERRNFLMRAAFTVAGLAAIAVGYILWRT